MVNTSNGSTLITTRYPMSLYKILSLMDTWTLPLFETGSVDYLGINQNFGRYFFPVQGAHSQAHSLITLYLGLLINASGHNTLGDGSTSLVNGVVANDSDIFVSTVA